MAKLLFSDIDGTLLQSDSTLSDTLRKAFSDMAEKGHSLVLTSGRPLSGTLSIYEQIAISFPHAYMICNNGSLIYDYNAGKIIYEKRIPMDAVDRIASMARQMRHHIQAYTDDSIVCEKETPELHYYISRVHMPVIFCSPLSASLTQPPYKMVAISLEGSMALLDLKNKINNCFSSFVTTTFSSPGYLDIIPQHVSKGTALSFLCDYLGISRTDTVAVGDSENDISMLQAAGLGFAMSNAEDIVKSSADKITALDCNHDGLLEIIRDYIIS